MRNVRRRGVAAVLAMMFLVIFSSLAAAMAIIAQGNLATADAHLKINRALSGAETGMQFVIYRLNQVTATVTTRSGLIDSELASQLWYDPANPNAGVRTALINTFTYDFHNLEAPVLIGDTLKIGPIALGPSEPQFTATFTPHPILGEDYDSAYYQRPPYSTMTPAVSNAAPLDATWIRIKVVCEDGPVGREVRRAIQMDFRMSKKVRFAVLSKSRVMIGRNVMIEGPIGSRFTETHLLNGHPIQMVSDFSGLSGQLDEDLQTLANTLHTNDINFDNRINVNSPTETSGITDPESYDLNDDGYIDDYDFFLKTFDSNADNRITELELGADADINRAQLLELIDTFGKPERAGFGDGVIDELDRYAKVRGQIQLAADYAGWNVGAGQGQIQDFYAGPVVAGFNEDPMTFESTDSDLHSFTPQDFNVAYFKTLANGDLASQASAQASANDPSDPTSPQPLGQSVREPVPFGAAHPYDFYDRPVYENMVFENVVIPKGTNALFKNCKFIGVTFVETATDNDDPLFNYVGMQEADGTPKHGDKSAEVTNEVTGDVEEVADTKTVSNNLRFHGCEFEGAIVSDAPQEFTHVRNKIAFTGRTRFKIDESENLTNDEKLMFKRSTILMPHYSIEMGTFISPFDSDEVVNLSGTIVGGVIDMRGQVKINGSIVTTFEPKADTGPVLGDTSPQFNTTLGYFPSSAGDLEAELPTNGVGVIQVRYDPSIPLPDGILGPIEIVPVMSTYFEGPAD